MDSLITSLVDILKYKLIGFINTGDKTFDSMLNVLVITVLTIITTKFLASYKELNWKKRLNFTKHSQGFVQGVNKVIVPEEKYKFKYSMSFETTDAVQKLCKFVRLKYPDCEYGKYYHMKIKLNFFSESEINKIGSTYDSSNFGAFKMFPVYYKNTSFVFLDFDDINRTIQLKSDDLEAIKEFCQHISSEKITINEP